MLVDNQANQMAVPVLFSYYIFDRSCLLKFKIDYLYLIDKKMLGEMFTCKNNSYKMSSLHFWSMFMQNSVLSLLSGWFWWPFVLVELVDWPASSLIISRAGPV